VLDLHRLGRAASEHLRVGVERGIAARAALGEERFLDVHHCELRDDPLGVLRRIYDFAGLELGPDVEATIVRWSAENAVGAHGVHRYTPEQFGLTAAQLRADFDFYLRRFDIAVEV